MLGVNKSHGNDRFYIPSKMRANYSHNNINNNDNLINGSLNSDDSNNQNNPQLQRTQNDVIHEGTSVGGKCGGKTVFSGYREPENRTNNVLKPALLTGFGPAELPLSNVERFLEAITPSVPAHFVSKTMMRGLKKSDVEFQPYFLLSDLWKSFKEWSAYGVSVPLVLNDSDSVVQYYVPYLSGIQLYFDPSKAPAKSRQTSDDSYGDYFSCDSSRDGSSDSERDRALMYSREMQNPYILPSDISLKMERSLSSHQRTALHETLLNDQGESGTSQGSLLFQYFEHNLPFCREPLVDKISDLSLQLPELKLLRSCDLLSSSWLSVAWYPIYRIPTGPTLRDLEACFLTYHSLHTPIRDAAATEAPVMVYPNEIDGSPRIALPVLGLASYKFGGSLWTPSSASDSQLVNSLWQAADSWLRLLQVNHPDYMFFCRDRIR
ncbi:hypothetical protein RND81_11G062700 [Saponaria officinalis]|uniref:Uncharacterized protein n=1 Tax=Saponaria officinalis TaxID=3572 RepID=A0AAW1HIP0_SAPOF